MKNNRALWIGRFQPFHNGHLDGAYQIQEDGIESLIIGVGSAQEKHTLKNPFTYEERKEMIQEGLEGKIDIPYRIFPVPDIPSNDQAWVKYIKENIPQDFKIEKKERGWTDYELESDDGFEIVYSGNPHVKNCFKTKKVREINESRVQISASTVREELGRFKDISKKVPEGISKYLSSIKAGDRIKKLSPPPLNPELAADPVIEYHGGIVLIDRVNKPYGWALPGGFVNNGESAEAAVVREAKEETNLNFKIEKQIHFYSDPRADPRRHIATVAYYGSGTGNLIAGDDAKGAMIVDPFEASQMKLASNRHNQIIKDYISMRGLKK